MDEIDRKIIAAVQGDIPIVERPYLKIAESIGIDEDSLLAKLQKLRDEGVIRRFGATLRHQQSGFSANAMVAWQVDEDRIEAVGQIMATFKEVSHCYRRNPTGEWPYNLYTMVHARDKATCRRVAEQMAQKASVAAYSLLFSRQELKKTSMAYFETDDD